MRLSAWFLVSTISRRLLSSSSNRFASSTIRSISLCESLVEAVIVIACCFPVPLSSAVTFKMPLASMSKVTSICGTPRGAGGMFIRWNRPSEVLSLANSRSPCRTFISTLVWLSAAVENIWLFFVGIVVFRSISLVVTPPRVSMPSESGVTSKSSTSFTSPVSTPA